MKKRLAVLAECLLIEETCEQKLSKIGETILAPVANCIWASTLLLFANCMCLRCFWVKRCLVLTSFSPVRNFIHFNCIYDRVNIFSIFNLS